MLEWNKKREGKILIFVLIINILGLTSCNKQEVKPVFLPQKTIVSTSVSILEKEDIQKDVVYEEKEINIDNRKSIVHILRIDLDSDVIVRPYLSFNKIYGFDYISSMVEKTNAYAGITSGFYHAYGRPSGLLVVNGNTISKGESESNSIIIKENEAYFDNIRTSINIIKNDTVVLEVETLNAPIENGITTAIYTKDYGKTDRLDYQHLVLHILDGVVVSIKEVYEEYDLPETGYILAIKGSYYPYDINLYDEVEIRITPEFNLGEYAYGCSSMLVVNSENVAKDYDVWIGTLNQYAPRTCVGIDDENNLVFVVVDGRLEDYSVGVTAKELADILLGIEIKDAALLDGGASAQMYINGETVNTPSTNNERLLAGCFIIER